MLICKLTTLYFVPDDNMTVGELREHEKYFHRGNNHKMEHRTLTQTFRHIVADDGEDAIFKFRRMLQKDSWVQQLKNGKHLRFEYACENVNEDGEFWPTSSMDGGLSHAVVECDEDE